MEQSSGRKAVPLAKRTQVPPESSRNAVYAFNCSPRSAYALLVTRMITGGLRVMANATMSISGTCTQRKLIHLAKSPIFS